MLSKKKNLIILILSIIITGMICSLIVYTFMPQTSKAESPNLYGTYQIDIRNINNTEYIAVIPSLSGDNDKSESQFQWYNIDKKMIAQGFCKISKEGQIAFDVNGKNIALLYTDNGKYYLVNETLEVQEIIKISEEPMVSIPLNE